MLIRVQANHDCWIAEWEGDPGRTLIKKSAKVYPNKKTAEKVCEDLNKKYTNRIFSIDKTIK